MPLDREEYIEQAYFFRSFRERLEENIPSQEVLSCIHEEVLSTTKLPMAIEFLRGELSHHGGIGEGMKRLPHYFTPFQAYVLQKSEEDRARFDQRVALEVLQREAEYRAGAVSSAGLFIYQFEAISRNRLGYDQGMSAIAEDPQYDEVWRSWIRRARLHLGTIDFADLIWFHSEQWLVDRKRQLRDDTVVAEQPVLFGIKEGRIAAANRGRDPLYMFAALQRQLGYPTVPRARMQEGTERLLKQFDGKIKELEKRIQILEAEAKGKLDLTEFIVKDPTFTDEGFSRG